MCVRCIGRDNKALKGKWNGGGDSNFPPQKVDLCAKTPQGPDRVVAFWGRDQRLPPLRPERLHQAHHIALNLLPPPQYTAHLPATSVQVKLRPTGIF